MHSSQQRSDILDIDILLEEFGDSGQEWSSNSNYASQLLSPSSIPDPAYQILDYSASSQTSFDSNSLGSFGNNSNSFDYSLHYPEDVMVFDSPDMWSHHNFPLDDIESSETSDYEPSYCHPANKAITETVLQESNKLYNSCTDYPCEPSRPDIPGHRKVCHEKRIRCKVPSCDHMTAKRRDMDRHIKAKHPHTLSEVVRYFCQVKGCKSGRKGFTRSDNLTRHMKKFHKGLV